MSAASESFSSSFSSESASPPALIDYFADLDDPRRENSTDYPLHEIIIITICAVVCGADGFTAIASFGRAKKDWLGSFLELENGIPSHDTIGRFFGLLDPGAFETRFAEWVRDACEHTGGDVVAVDGKTLRRSYDRASGKAALHMVSAWASENGLTLGQVATDAKSNEITAIPDLLKVLDVAGCIVTIDAMGCQTAIAEAITDADADYVLALKDNQKTLRTAVEATFDRLRASRREPCSSCTSVTGGHGRVETRRCWALAVADTDLTRFNDWHGLRTICMVEYERDEYERDEYERDEESDGGPITERRYYISSLPPDAEALLKATRRHWHIENRMHWVLDVAFQEDQSRIRAGHAAQNMATVRRLALSLLQQDERLSMGIKNKRLRAGWDHKYLQTLLQEN
ncbi:MAG: ISAs1 family transposase [Bacteroidota bacterium]